MTISEIRESSKPYLSAADVAETCRANPSSIRQQARNKPERLGFPVEVIGQRVRIPRLDYLKYLKKIYGG